MSSFSVFLFPSIIFFFFFFQAEDGIRDGTVTGVQTCALPISWRTAVVVAGYDRPVVRLCLSSAAGSATWYRSPATSRSSRSEERRVGKECRSRWSAYH